MEDTKPGQKFPTPTPGFGDRVFYETLLRQRPDSEMAQEWCVTYGVLPYEEAAKLNKKILKRKGKSITSSSSSSSDKKKKKAKVIKDEGHADMAVSSSEAIGTGVI